MNGNRDLKDEPQAICGIAGAMTRQRILNDSSLWLAQSWVSERRRCPSYDEPNRPAYIRASVRFDDECKNGHNTFAITADITSERGRWLAGGCCHDEVAAAFPELAGLIKWHLTSSDGPMHYIANTLYFAGDRDHSGRAAGEASASVDVIQFGAVPIRYRLPRGLVPFLREIATYDPEGQRAALIPLAVAHVAREASYTPGHKFAPKYQFAGQPPLQWHECAFDTEEEAERFAAAYLDHEPSLHTLATAWSDGKARELDNARSAAIWPEATDAELCQPREVLKAALEARHPALMAAFRSDLDAAGVAWSPATAAEEVTP